MNELTKSLEELPNTFSGLWKQLIEFSPKLFGAVILIIFGWFVARMLKALSIRLASIFNRVLKQLLSKGNLARFELSSTITTLFSKIVFWGTIIFFAVLSAEILGLTAFSIWVNRLIAYFPQIFAGILIIVFGVLLSALGKELTLSATEASQISYSKLLGGIVQGTILISAIIIGLDQVGIAVDFIVTLLSIILGAVLGSLALALGLGTKDLASNLISGHQLKKVYQPGQNLRFGSIEGTVLELNPTSMVLSTTEGRVIVPAKFFHTDPSFLIIKEENPNE